MGWSLGYLPLKEPELLDEFLSAAGKALYVANSFETKCESVLCLAQLSRHLKDTGDLDASLRLLEARQHTMLGRTIGELKEFPIIKKGDLATLERARDARNFIAHEGAGLGPLFGVTAEKLRTQLVQLRLNLRPLAAGDNLVSSWLYEIEERRPAPARIRDHYPDWIESWVFGEKHLTRLHRSRCARR